MNLIINKLENTFYFSHEVSEYLSSDHYVVEDFILPDSSDVFNEYVVNSTQNGIAIKPKTLEEVKEAKLKELEQAFETNSSIPVTVGLKTYNGGKGSAQSLRDYIQLVQESGGTEYQIWDTSNVISTYTLAEANAIKLAVGAAVAQAELNLRNKKNLVDAALTILEVEAVTW